MSFTRYFSMALELGLEKSMFIKVVSLSVIATLVESLGLAMIVPIYQYMNANGDIEWLLKNEKYWLEMQQVFAVAGLQLSLTTFLLTAMVLIIIRQAAAFLRLLIVAKTREALKQHVRESVFSRYLAAQTHYQHKMAKGELVSELTNELQKVGVLLVAIISLITIIVNLTIYLTFLFITSWQMTLISVAIIGLAMVPLQRLQTQTRSAGEKSVAANSEATSFVVERLQMGRVIRLAGIETVEKTRMSRHAAQQFLTMMQVERLMAIAAVAVEPIILAMVLVMLYISVVWLNMATITLGLFLIIIVRLLPIARDFVKARQIISSTISSVEVIYDRLRALKVHAELDDGSQVLDNIENNIQFAKVSFKYDGTDTVVLKDISIEIPAGKTTAIIGPSGAGKSTLIDLLPRLRKPSAGTIYFDGQDLADIRLDSLRRNISYVPQEPQIFDASIADHIRLGKANAAMDEIRDAARLAGATQFIEALPHGYETVVGERGGRLSGGQRQRLDLARAIVRKAPVLIMDEPTSNLDPKSEKDFLNALGQIQRELKPTVIVVAHRLSTIRHADKIIILSNGIVEASGRHEELIEISKWYKDLAVGQA